MPKAGKVEPQLSRPRPICLPAAEKYQSQRVEAWSCRTWFGVLCPALASLGTAQPSYTLSLKGSIRLPDTRVG